MKVPYLILKSNGKSPTTHLVVNARIELAPKDGSFIGYTTVITPLLYPPCNVLWPLHVTKCFQKPTNQKKDKVVFRHPDYYKTNI